MENDFYHQMYENEASNWWFKGKRLAVHSLVDKFVSRYSSVLDIGCGTGIVLEGFRARNKEIFGTDVSTEAIEFSKKRGLENIHRIDFSREHIKEKNFDLILCLDVLEHIEKDRDTLINIAKNMHEDSYFLLTVPAFQFLWGVDDIVLHHKRRYTRKQIVNLFENCGFKVIKSSYSNFLLFFPGLIIRWSEKLRPMKLPKTTIKGVPKLLNELLILFYKFEAWFLKRFNLPVGTSVICLAKKAGGGSSSIPQAIFNEKIYNR